MKLPRLSKSVLLLGIALGGCSHAQGLFTDSAAEPAEAARAAQTGSAAGSDLESAVRSAQLQRRNGDTNAATQILSQLVLVAPDDPRVLAEYGKTLLDKGAIPDALAFLQRAAELNAQDWSVFSALGVAHSQNANYQAARMSFARALMLKPNDPTVLNNYALTQVQVGDLAGAEMLLMQAGLAGADHPRIAQNLAMVQRLKQAAPPVAAATAPLVQAAPAIAAVPAPAAPATAAPAQLTSPPEPVSAPPADTTAAIVAPREPIREASLPVVMSTPIGASDTAPAPAPRAAEPATVRIVPGRATYVQVAAYNTQDKAGQLVARLEGLNARVASVSLNGQSVYRVRIGPLLSSDDAAKAMARVKALGYAEARYVSEAAPPAERAGAPTLRLSDSGPGPQ